MTYGRKQNYLPLYFTIIFLVWMSMVFYTFPEALDIVHYYDYTEMHSLHYNSVNEYIEFELSSHIDFIYLSLLFLCHTWNLSPDIVTIFYISLYYISICAITHKIQKRSIPGIIIFFVLLCAPYCWVQSISRNLAAIATVYLAIYQFLCGRKIWGLILSIAAIFTHFSIIMLILICITSYFLRSFKIHRKIIYLIFISSIILSFLAPSIFLDFIIHFADNSDNHYNAYATLESQAFLLNPYLGLGDKIPMLYLYLSSVYFLLINKKQDFSFWVLLILCSLLGFAFFTSTMFVQRIAMMMPLFVAGNVCSIYSQSHIYRRQLYVLSAIGSLFILWNFWAYRLNFQF